MRPTTPSLASILKPMAFADRDGAGAAAAAERAGPAAAGTCTCGCPCCSSTWQRSLKLKLGETDGSSSLVKNEAAALRQVLAAREETMENLHKELEEERNASSSAVAEAMSMIARLQEEKADAAMEVLQYGRMVEETMDHDQQEIASLEDRLVKQDHVVQALSCGIQGYRHRLLSYGIEVDGEMLPSEPQTPYTATDWASTPVGASPQFDPFTSEYPPDKGTAAATAAATPVDAVPQFDAFPAEYPQLRCIDVSSTELDLNPYPETPPEDIDVFRPRAFPMAQVPTSSFKEKGVVLRQSPRDLQSFSQYDSVVGSPYNGDGHSDAAEDSSCSWEGDGTSDRVYTVDAVYVAREDYARAAAKEVGGGEKGGRAAKEAEIKKLEAVEADEESMKQTLISMSMDKEQLALLKDITQMFKEAAADEKKAVEKQTSSNKPSIWAMLKSVVSAMLWKMRERRRVKYTFGLSPSNCGLKLLLDKTSPRLRARRLLTKAQG